MKGARRPGSNPRRTETAAMTWPVKAPETASTAASCGSITQAQIDRAVSPKAKPDRPCTKPATTAPRATTR